MSPYIFCLVFLHLFIVPYTTAVKLAAYVPVDYILLNCGADASSDTTSEDGRKWITDERSKFSIFNPEEVSFASTASYQYSSVTQIPYMTARAFHDKFTYSFPVSPGLKFLRLYFYLAQYSGFDATTSFFSVFANNYVLLNNFCAYLTAEDSQEAWLIKEFMVPVSITERLNVTFLPSPKSLAFVNGIEVVSIPENLYGNHPKNPICLVYGRYTPFSLPNATAFETVYRLNVGGATVANVDDSGMLRTWLDDSPFIFGAAAGVIPYGFNGTINYTQETPPYTAPVNVYSTMRTMGPKPKINTNYNLTWRFSIDIGFYYLLRLHFCETEIEVTKPGQRVFDVFINNQTAELNADVIYWSGQENIPVYKDYILFIPIAGQRKQNLWLALHPSKDVGSEYNDAILNGLEIYRLNTSDGSLAVPNPEINLSLKPMVPYQHSVVEKKKCGRLKVIITATVSFSILLLLFLLIFWRLFHHKRKALVLSDQRKTKELPDKGKTSELPDKLCVYFTLGEIQSATNFFDDSYVIGRGGFGNVYKGFIKGIKFAVAIKRLNSKSQQGAREFQAEIQLLSQLRHRHIVSLIGYCNENNEMILVYDFMANGTLRDHLYGGGKISLSWKQRLEICIGAAHGLDYLHSGAVHRIIHRDVKSTNILLDENYVAKVSDFGLSKMSPLTDTPISTVVKGTFGYMDPEYYRCQQLTEKSDVYSFGVVLFEVLCARRAVDSQLEHSKIGLADWARKCVQNKSIGEIIDPFLKGKISPDCLRIYTNIAENCISKNGMDRPTMKDVLGALQLALQLQENDGAEQISQAEVQSPATLDTSPQETEDSEQFSQKTVDEAQSQLVNLDTSLQGLRMQSNVLKKL